MPTVDFAGGAAAAAARGSRHRHADHAGRSRRSGRDHPTGRRDDRAAGGATPPRVPGVVSIQPVGGEGQPPAQPARATLVPAALEHPAGNVFATPIMLSGVSNVGTVTVSLTFNPAVLRATNVTQGTFMSAGGTTTTFAPKIDRGGRVDIVISRPTDQSGRDDGGGAGAARGGELPGGRRRHESGDHDDRRDDARRPADRPSRRRR